MQQAVRATAIASAETSGADSRDGIAALLTRRKLWIGGLAVFAATGYLISAALRGSAVYYLTVAELRALPAEQRAQPVRVAGPVVPGTITRPAAAGDPLRFTIADQPSGQQRLPVVYSGLVPDVFGENIEVVVEGHYTGTQFEATTLLAKCPSKFEASTRES